MKDRDENLVSIIPEYDKLKEILRDRKLAALGDAYVNFIFSLALTREKKKPMGVKIKGGILAEALKRAGLRGDLPSRCDRHFQADAAEALLVYAWIKGFISLGESILILCKYGDKVEAFRVLLQTVKERLKL